MLTRFITVSLLLAACSGDSKKDEDKPNNDNNGSTADADAGAQSDADDGEGEGGDSDSGEPETARDETATPGPPEYIEIIENVWDNRDKIGGYRIVKQPKFLRHFTCHFEEIKK